MVKDFSSITIIYIPRIHRLEIECYMDSIKLLMPLTKAYRQIHLISLLAKILKCFWKSFMPVSQENIYAKQITII